LGQWQGIELQTQYQRFFYLPADAQFNCLKNSFKVYIKIDIKTAPTFFDVITIFRERTIRSR